MLGISILSDMKGRKFTFLLTGSSGVIGISFILLGSFSKTYWVIMIGQILAGIAGSSFPIISYTVTGEVCSDKLKQRSVMMYCVVWYILS